MNEIADMTRPVQAGAKSVQGYIDELPVWSDGTRLHSTPMTAMQWRIWGLAATGKFFEGFVVFMTGVALPLIVREFHIGAAEKGIMSAASLAGILLGAILLGGLSDYFGRKRMFIAEMIFFCACLSLLLLTTDFLSLATCLFGLGMALGCDYPTSHMIISESIPSSARGKLVLGAFAFQAVGALAGTGVGCLVLVLVPDLSAWRWMFATAIAPALLVTIGRFFITESPNWLAARGHLERAEVAATRLLLRTPKYPSSISLVRHTIDVARPIKETSPDTFLQTLTDTTVMPTHCLVPFLRFTGSATGCPALFVGFADVMLGSDFAWSWIDGYASSRSRSMTSGNGPTIGSAPAE